MTLPRSAKFALLLVIAAAFSDGARAADVAKDCTPVDLRPMIGPIRHQGDKGWCYANVAADLMDFRFRSALGARQLSAAHLALIFNRMLERESEANFGSDRVAISMAIGYGRLYGLCLQSAEARALQSAGDGSLQDKLRAIMDYKRLHGVGEYAELDRRFAASARHDGPMAGVERDEFYRALARSTVKSWPLHFADLICRERWYPKGISNLATVTPVTGWMARVGVPLARDRRITQMDAQLRKGNIVGISYYANFLTNPEGRKEGAHVSVIAGRRWNGAAGRCEYLIRNSWGAGCDAYRPDIQAACEGGNLWVDGAELQRNLNVITYFE